MADIYYICRDCGKVFSESEMNYHSEIETSYSHGPKSYDVGYDCCPGCGSDDFEEVSLCQVCGEAMIEGKNFNSNFSKHAEGVCDKCMEKYTSIEAIFNLLKHDNYSSVIEEFVIHMFGDEDAVLDAIKDCLLKAEKLNPTSIKDLIRDFLDRDRDWCGDVMSSYEDDQNK